MSFLCLQFLPKNERKQVELRFHSSKVEFVRLFFGRNADLKKSFRLCLNFIDNILFTPYLETMTLVVRAMRCRHQGSGIIIFCSHYNASHWPYRSYSALAQYHTIFSFFFCLLLDINRKKLSFHESILFIVLVW